MAARDVSHRRNLFSRGFTLVELLLAMVASGICLAAVYSVFYSGFRAWRQSAMEARLNFDGVYVTDTITRDLRSVYFVEDTPSQEKDVLTGPVLEGASDWVKFLTAAHKSYDVPWPGYSVRYYVEKAQGDAYGLLCIEVLPASGRVKLLDESKRSVLADRVYRFQLRYLDKGQWTDKWEQQEIPSAVEISVEIGSDDNRLRRTFVTCVDMPAWQAAAQS